MTGNIQIDQLVRSLLQKDSLEQCSLQELRQFAGRHPYFGAAQLLLAKKMQVENADGYHDQLQKTYLFFNNPLWVQRLLGETGNLVVVENAEPIQEETPEDPDSSHEKNGREMELTQFAVNAGTGDDHNATENLEIKDITITTETIQETGEEPVREIISKESIKEELSFEPYHMVDYFASQGIKYKPEEQPTDKFGQQLKSFTDWLKTMKRLSSTEAIPKTETAQEQKVELMAERSLDEKDVFTEAMAEVWVKQGNPEKARIIYEKLSLQDPSKRAYFAAKIEDLQK
jgi:hypothetical protein